MLACSEFFVVGPEQGHQICDCKSTLQLHVTFASRCSGVNGIAVVQAALGYKYSVYSWAAGKPDGIGIGRKQNVVIQSHAKVTFSLLRGRAILLLSRNGS